ncbi:hypothetical protein ACFO9Q_00575 [Paenibacillus sp. GCM10023252]|uniref:hypothetical protein n=1 Tax=Paenibacillus sp. GCM10023252 TaxID=3252649 RepID=UPI00361A3987
MKNKLKDPIVYIVLVIFLIDFVFIGMRVNGYHLTEFRQYELQLVLAINMLLLVTAGILSKRKWIFFPLALLFVFPMIGYSIMTGILNPHYHSVTSPNKSSTLLIEHRIAVLGEKNHFYKFFRKVNQVPYLMKELQGSHISIVVMFDDSNFSSEDALRLNRAVWTDEDTIVLSPVNMDKTTINLNR